MHTLKLFFRKVLKQKNISVLTVVSLGLDIAVSVLVGLWAINEFSFDRFHKDPDIPYRVYAETTRNGKKAINASYVKWMVVSFVLACPLAYLFVKSWQDAFAVKAALSWWIFALSGVIAVVVAMATVSYLTWKTARINPVEALKSE